MNIEVIRYRLPIYWACPLINDDYTGLTNSDTIHSIKSIAWIVKRI